MRKANRKVNELIYRRLAEARMSNHERESAAYAFDSAEAIVDAIVWAKEKIAYFGTMLPGLGFKH
jgi:hypothetical protein